MVLAMLRRGISENSKLCIWLVIYEIELKSKHIVRLKARCITT